MKQHENDKDMSIKCDNKTLNCDITYEMYGCDWIIWALMAL